MAILFHTVTHSWQARSQPAENGGRFLQILDLLGGIAAERSAVLPRFPTDDHAVWSVFLRIMRAHYLVAA